MKTVYLNQDRLVVDTSLSLADFLKQHASTEQHFAVALNSEFIPRVRYAEIFLKENDQIDMILPMQGG